MTQPGASVPDNEAIKRSEPADGTLLTVSVSPLRLADLPMLRSFPMVHRLDQPDASLRGSSLVLTGVRSIVPRKKRRAPAFVARTGGHRLGMVGFTATQPDGRWTLDTLATATGVYAAEPLWNALMQYAVQQAGLRGVRMLFARIPVQSALEVAFRHDGWNQFATETIFVGRDLRPNLSVPIPRPMDVHDTWSVYQLYCATVPREVQQVEAWTSRHWEVPTGPAVSQPRLTGWVIEEGGEIVGHARVRSSGQRHVVEFLIHPDHRDLAGGFIDGVLRAIADQGLARVSVVVRGYQSELARPLEERGFTPVIEQSLLVRHTTARVRRRATNLIRFPFALRERSAQRVPTMLRRTAEDRRP